MNRRKKPVWTDGKACTKCMAQNENALKKTEEYKLIPFHMLILGLICIRIKSDPFYIDISSDFGRKSGNGKFARAVGKKNLRWSRSLWSLFELSVRWEEGIDSYSAQKPVIAQFMLRKKLELAYAIE